MVDNKLISKNVKTIAAYRPDIDGLRAIAILAVVAYHAFPNIFYAGFIGVDIFFVISGYLITSVIFSGLVKEEFSFFDFYTKRVRRIFPALLIALTFLLLVGWIGFTANIYEGVGQHIRGASTFTSNFLLWRESGYFDRSADTKPLLHLWSLGIEEQFYLLWPLLLYFLYKFKKNLFLFTVVFMVFSFSINAHQIYGDKVGAFYAPYGRVWELLIGASLALYECTYKGDSSQKIVGNFFVSFAPFIGAVFILIGFIWIDEASLFPGFFALLPTLGAFLIILGRSSWVNTRFLSNKILVWFGLISYPLYIWHWILLSTAKLVINPSLEIEITITIILLSVALAWLTYKFFELPIRSIQPSKSSAVLISLMVFVGICGHVIAVNDGFKGRYKANDNDRVIRVVPADKVHPNLINCSNIFGSLSGNSKAYSTCIATSKNPNFVILGDSHANHLLYGFANSEDLFWQNTMLLSTASCAPAIGFSDTSKWCPAALEVSLNEIAKNSNIKTIVIASSKYTNGTDYLSLLNGYRKTISNLVSLEKRVIFFIDPIGLPLDQTFHGYDPEACIIDKGLYLKALMQRVPDWCNGIQMASYNFSNEKGLDVYWKFINELKREFPNVIFYDPNRILCNKDVCSVFNDGKLLYEDFGHLSIYGSKFIVDDFVKIIELQK